MLRTNEDKDFPQKIKHGKRLMYKSHKISLSKELTVNVMLVTKILKSNIFPPRQLSEISNILLTANLCNCGMVCHV